MGPSSTTNAALVEKLEPEIGTFSAPGKWPPAKSTTGLTSSTCAPSGGAGTSGGSGCAPTNGPRFISTIRSMFGGRGTEIAADSAMNIATSSYASAGLNRRSKPIVVDAFELIALPHRDPATCPG